VKLSETMLCINCEEICRFGEHIQCPSCGSHVIVPASQWLPSGAQIKDVIAQNEIALTIRQEEIAGA